MLALALLACAASEPVVLVQADAGRPGDPGEDGPDGACLLELDARARVVERVTYDLVAPCDADGGWAGASPLVGLVHGGLVAPERYRWLAAHLATRGYAVVAPAHPADLAITAPGNTSAAADDLRWRSAGDGPLAGLVDEEAPTAILGHSLGGTVGAMQWVADPSWGGLGLLASWPADGTGVEDRPGPVLSLIGDAEPSDLQGRARDGAARALDPARFGLVAGMNHYAWTDDPTPGELAGDGPLGRDLALVRRDALTGLDAWLAGDVHGDPGARDLLDDLLELTP